jgi:hypothetical protein
LVFKYQNKLQFDLTDIMWSLLKDKKTRFPAIGDCCRKSGNLLFEPFPGLFIYLRVASMQMSPREMAIKMYLYFNKDIRYSLF